MLDFIYILLHSNFFVFFATKKHVSELEWGIFISKIYFWVFLFLSLQIY